MNADIILPVNDPELLFFTSDNHYGHKLMLHVEKVARGSRMGLPTQDTASMDAELTRQWNAVVPPVGSTVFCLGDFCFKGNGTHASIVRTLNGENKTLLPGNHDKQIPGGMWSSILPNRITHLGLQVRGIGEMFIVISHFPLQEWEHSYRGSWHLCGHTHGSLDNNGVNPLFANNRVDVGVDSRLSFPRRGMRMENPYAPFSLAELLEIVGKSDYSTEFRVR
jgi:calcineurin-like phosphoesterase family protein